MDLRRCKRIAFCLLLLAAPAWADTFVETGIETVDMCVSYRRGEAPTGSLKFVVVDDGGLRRERVKNLGPFLTPAERTQIRNFIDTVVDRLHTTHVIPTPTPSPAP